MTESSKRVSEIDRLIELASIGKPGAEIRATAAAGPAYSLSVEDQKDPSPSMWRALLQLRVFLPYLAKVLPLVERGLLGTNITGHAANAIDSGRRDQGIVGIEAAQRDVSSALDAQSGELKFLQEQLGWLAKSIEKDTQLHEELNGNLASLRKLVTIWAVVIVVLLVSLIGLAIFALATHSFKAG